MDSVTEKSCLEEISTLVFDSDQKVSLKTISNNWHVSNSIAKEVLDKWLTQNQKKIKELVKEFLVQGINSKDIFTISVVTEEIKEKLQTKWKNFSSWPYSIETKSNSRSLDIPKFEPIEVKNIKINPGTRDLHIHIKTEPSSSSNVDTTKIKTPFGMVKPLDKKEIKKETVDEKESCCRKQEKINVITPAKEEDASTKKSSPDTISNGSKPTTKKGSTKPVAQGKASISSFFSKSTAPASTKKQSQNMNEIKTVEIKLEKPEIEVKEETSLKRSAPADSKKKPSNKKIKLKDPPNKKRSRIQVIDDSSEEEQDEEELIEEPESKFIKFDREFTPEKNTNRSPQQSPKELSPEKEPEVKKGQKNKAKRYVTKRFETDDGFVRTERVLEEYSASEDENDENKKKNSPPQEKTSPIVEKVTPQKKTTKAKAKPKEKETAGKIKQGSIMNFFSKK